jgi:hypothetical protein
MDIGDDKNMAGILCKLMRADERGDASIPIDYLFSATPD